MLYPECGTGEGRTYGIVMVALVKTFLFFFQQMLDLPRDSPSKRFSRRFIGQVTRILRSTGSVSTKVIQELVLNLRRLCNSVPTTTHGRSLLTAARRNAFIAYFMTFDPLLALSAVTFHTLTQDCKRTNSQQERPQVVGLRPPMRPTQLSATV